MLLSLKRIQLGYNPRANLTQDPPVSKQMSVALGFILSVCSWMEFSKNKDWSGSSPVFYGASSLTPLPGKYSCSEITVFLNNLVGGHKFYTLLPNLKHSNSLTGTGFVQSHLIDLKCKQFYSSELQFAWRHMGSLNITQSVLFWAPGLTQAYTDGICLSPSKMQVSWWAG